MSSYRYDYFSGIAHIVDHVEDLYRNQAETKDGFRILINSRLNGPPHIGTLVNYMTGFVLAERLRKTYQKPASIIVELLDNLSDSSFQRNYWIDDKEYCLMDSIETNAYYAQNYQMFIKVLHELSSTFKIPIEVRNYRDIISLPSFRKSVLEVLQHAEYFSHQLQPSDGKLHIRIPCPVCGLMQKKPAGSIIEQVDKEIFRIKEVCPKHGIHEMLFSPENDTIIGLNNTFRIFCRGLTLVDEDIAQNTLSIIINGYDWAGTWPLQIHFSGMFYLNRPMLPTILYCPLILDHHGFKLSKSKIPTTSTDLWFYNVSLLNLDQLLKIRKEVERWFDCTEDFFTNYNIMYFSKILEE